jgi:hypothetical protein
MAILGQNQLPKSERVATAVDYDPFVRGRLPVGVRTLQALDTARNRVFPCEMWYPAAAQHAGQDMAPGTQDVFTVASSETSRSQMAVRNFMDNVEHEHESVRKMSLTGELAWIPREMRPIAELCSGEKAHVFVRGLALCHMDAILRRQEGAQRFLFGDIEAELARRGIEVIVVNEAERG